MVLTMMKKMNTLVDQIMNHTIVKLKKKLLLNPPLPQDIITQIAEELTTAVTQFMIIRLPVIKSDILLADHSVLIGVYSFFWLSLLVHT